MGRLWKNLLLEHELYCHGHFIEAGVSHFEATGGRELLGLAERAADLIVEDFRDAGPRRTSGHQEIEIALIRLFRVTGTPAYLDTARNLLERRGRMSFFWFHFLAQTVSHLTRSRAVRRRDHAAGAAGFELGENLGRREPPFIMLRSAASFLSGAYQQQDRPLRGQREPRGHAVRWTYQATGSGHAVPRAGREGSPCMAQPAPGR